MIVFLFLSYNHFSQTTLADSLTPKLLNDTPTKIYCAYPIYLKMRNDYKPFSILFGLNQPIVTNGFNVELNYWFKRFVFDYSHGFGLQIKGNLVSKEAKEQHLAFNITHSIGVGFGYCIFRNLNLRVEPKIHIWEVYYDNQFKSKSTKISEYTTYTLGLGLYYRWLPFHKKQNALNGLTIAPSVRWWPNVATTLKEDKLNYINTITGKNEIHKANNIGAANTPFFANVSIGYSFGFHKKEKTNAK